MSPVQAAMQRLANAEDHFAEQVQARIQCTRADGLRVLEVYLKERVVKLDLVGGRFGVVHGAFWDAPVLRRALAKAGTE